MATWLNYYYFNQQASQSPAPLNTEINPFWYFWQLYVAFANTNFSKKSLLLCF